MSPGETNAQKEAAKAAEEQKKRQDQQATAAKNELNRRASETAARGSGINSFVRTGETGLGGSAILSRVLGA